MNLDELKYNIMEKKILAEIDELLREHYPEDIEKIILYGSRSRGDANKFSDYDILVILKHDYDWKFKNELRSVLYELDIKYDIFIDTRLISKAELQTIKGKLPFIQNAFKEGISA